METKIEKAINFAKEKHAGQYRMGGDEYITHPLAVMELIKEKGYDENYQLCALFHDLLEDTDASENEILKLSNEKVLEAVKLLTKTKDYIMKDYVESIKKNNIAFVVKGMDRLHNLRSAKIANIEFKKKYIDETINWYMDFNEEIDIALKELIESIDK